MVRGCSRPEEGARKGSPVIEFQLRRTGMLIIVSAPSGGGKSTILRALLASDPSLAYSVSATTRPPRANEVDGKDYHFHTVPQFEQLLAEDAFYESALVHGNYYGTLRGEVDAKLERGLDVLLDIDVQGSMRLREKVRDCVSIFILPPNIATLEKRLRDRGLDEEEVIQRRLRNARSEVRMADKYDYVLVNEDLQDTIENVRLIIRAQRFRASRLILKDGKGSTMPLSPAAAVAGRPG